MLHILPSMGRKYDLAVFDMDGTLTKVNSSWRYILEEFGGDNHETYLQWVNGEIDEAEFQRISQEVRDGTYQVTVWEGGVRHGLPCA